jgi:hypothetical protein
MSIKTTKTGKDYCPGCNALIDHATSFDNNTPNPGDITICFYCAEILYFSEDMSVDILPDVLLNEMDEKTRAYISQVQKAIIFNK